MLIEAKSRYYMPSEDEHQLRGATAVVTQFKKVSHPSILVKAYIARCRSLIDSGKKRRATMNNS